MYAKSSVNVRSLPRADGERLGSLSTNQEVTVTGQCNETGWYRIEYDGRVAYVSNNYLSDSKVETPAPTTAAPSTPSNDSGGGNSAGNNTNTGEDVSALMNEVFAKYGTNTWVDMGDCMTPDKVCSLTYNDKNVTIANRQTWCLYSSWRRWWCAFFSLVEGWYYTCLLCLSKFSSNATIIFRFCL